MQRADEDPALFNVVYIGAHTCVQSGAAAGQAAAAAQAPDHNLLQSLSAGLTVKSEGLPAAAEPTAEEGLGERKEYFRWPGPQVRILNGENGWKVNGRP